MRDLGLIFMHCHHYPRCRDVIDKRLPDYCTFQIMSRGEIEVFYDDRRYELTGTWFWCCWPGPHTRFHCMPRCPYWVHRYVSFKGPLVNRWMEFGLFPILPQRPTAGTRYVHQFDQLLKLVHRGDRIGRFRAINLLESILFRLADERGTESQAWVDQVRERVARQGTLWPDYGVIAQEMEMGLSTLRRRFRRDAGVSLHRDLLDRRIGAAQDLLAQTSLPVKAVAERLGYRDVYFFSRQFHQIAGVTAEAYRRSSRA